MPNHCKTSFHQRAIIYFALLVSIVFSIACSTAVTKQDDVESIQGLLWQISKDGEVKGYLFGTIHSEDERVTKLAQPVESAFTESNTVALEMKLDSTATQSVLRQMYFQDGRKLNQLLTPQLYQRSVSAMNDKGVPENLVELMKPWAVFSVLNMPKQRTGLYLDAILYQRANDMNKSVIGLETYQEQIAVFDTMELDVQISLLESTLDNLQNMDEMLNETINVYLSRDLAQIQSLSDKYNSMLDEKVSKVFEARLLIDRNHRMHDRMLPLLDEASVFVAVGALHLPGEQGIVSLLKKSGFTLVSLY